MIINETSLYWMAINNIPFIGPTCGTYLYQNNFDPKEFWEAGKEELMDKYESSDQLCRKIISERKKIEPERIMNTLNERKIGWASIDSPLFPEGLKTIPDPPTTIYFLGNLNVLTQRRVAIVGSRKPSSYGKDTTAHFARSLSRSGIVIVSGLAMGVDSVAHQTALDSGITIAVLGCGIDIAYPARNRLLYSKIRDSGCIISEYPPGTDPLPFRFPARNRIISGLSELVIVTEANYKSGALLTADFAAAQGKDVYAIPGNIYSPLSKGPHKLIKNGAIPVDRPDDILEEMNISANTGATKTDTAALETEEAQILMSIPFAPIHINDLIVRQKMPAEKVSAILSILEIKGFVSQDIGMLYQRRK